MKYTTKDEFKNLLREFFKRKILESVGVGTESVDSANAGFTNDYKDEYEGPGTRYEIPEESVDRARRGEDKDGDESWDYPEEDEGDGATYEHLKFEANYYHGDDTEKVGHDRKPDLKETNLYSDSDKKSGEKTDETNFYSDSDKEGEDDTDKEGKGHAAERGSKGNYPGPPAGLTAGKIPRLKDAFVEGRMMLGLIEIAPLGWEKSGKDVKNKGATPGGKKK